MDSWGMLRQVAGDPTLEPLQVSVVSIQRQTWGVGFSQEIERPVEYSVPS